MKKIIALIKPNAALFYFVNQVHRQHPIELVIIEDKHLGKVSTLNKIKTRLALGKKTIKHPHAAVRIKSRKTAELYQQHLGNDWQDLNTSLRIVYCQNINEPAIHQLLAAEKPDLLLDHGTSIVKDHILAQAPLALNLHWGLSPYYRGTHCTEWALINWDPYNIGVTIHRLTKAIDGGDVLAQSRVEIQSNDTVNSINLKLTKAGTELVIKALNDWQQDHELTFQQQDHGLGYLTLNRQWSKALKKEINHIEQHNIINQMLKTPARKELLPLIEFSPKIEA